MRYVREDARNGPRRSGLAGFEREPEAPDRVTDAWFFREREAPRCQAAKYGEFRVDASGKALRVGLRGLNLETL